MLVEALAAATILGTVAAVTLGTMSRCVQQAAELEREMTATHLARALWAELRLSDGSVSNGGGVCAGFEGWRWEVRVEPVGERWAEGVMRVDIVLRADDGSAAPHEYTWTTLMAEREESRPRDGA